MYGANVGILKLDLVDYYPAIDTPQYTTMFELIGKLRSNNGEFFYPAEIISSGRNKIKYSPKYMRK